MKDQWTQTIPTELGFYLCSYRIQYGENEYIHPIDGNMMSINHTFPWKSETNLSTYQDACFLKIDVQQPPSRNETTSSRILD